jgi:hypothetical protein
VRNSGGSDIFDELSRMISKLDRRSGGAYRQARAAWAWTEIAGPAVASHTTGAHLRGDELVVFVDSPVWAAELSALAEPYRLAINEALGQETVRSVRFSVSRKVEGERLREQQERQAEEYQRRDAVESVPLTEQERAQVIASAEAIPDDELREAVIRATIADLEWKKGLRAAKRREGPPQSA